MKLLHIKTLSPIHIGSGEVANGLSYLVDPRKDPMKVYFFQFQQIARILNPIRMEKFAQWIENQKFLNIKKFALDELQDRGLLDKIQNNCLYSLDGYGRRDGDRMRIDRNIEIFLKTFHYQPYIPGSEIKGAMRTAVLYHLLQQDSNYNILKKKIETFRDNFANALSLFKKDRKASSYIDENDLRSIPHFELEKIFGSKRANEIRNRLKGRGRTNIKVSDIKRNFVKIMSKIEEKVEKNLMRGLEDNAKYDILKLLSISDSDSKKPEKCLFVSSLEVVNISRKFPLFQEFCKKGEEFVASITLISNKLVNSSLGFSKNQQRLTNYDVLLSCCYEFSKRLLQEEIEYFKNQGKYQSVLKELKEIERQNTRQTPVVRIGKDQGYLSFTISMLIKDRDPELYQNVVVHATKNTSYSSSFPKTRRIIAVSRNGRTEYLPLGWVKLSVEN